MQLLIPEQSIALDNPIKITQQFIDANAWPIHRVSNDEVSFEIAGKWADYDLNLQWQDQYEALHIRVELDVIIPKQLNNEARQTVNLLNQNMWMGHFDMLEESGKIRFRHTLPLRGAGGTTPEQIEDLIDMALGECERGYPAIFQVASGTASAEMAVAAALLETVGSA